MFPGPVIAVPVLLVAQLARATLTGIVHDAETGEPLVGASVILPGADRSTLTDAAGRYVLVDVAAGPQHVGVRHVGHAARTLHALVPREGPLVIDVALRPEPHILEEVEVRMPVLVRGADVAGSAQYPDRSVSMLAVRNHPSLAEADVFQALSAGEIAMGAESPTGVHVRGGAADQVAYVLDGVPVFSPYHAAGVFSAWSPDALAEVRITPFPAEAEDPPALSGVLAATTRPPGSAFRGQGGFSTTHARATFDGPIGASGFGWLASVRTGYPGLIAPEDEASHVIGRTADALLTMDGPWAGGRLHLLGYDARNRIGAAARVPGDTGSGEAELRNNYDWRSRSAGVRWVRSLGERSVRAEAWGAAGDATCAWAPDSVRLDLASTRRNEGILAAVEQRTPRHSSALGVRIERDATSYTLVADTAAARPFALASRAPVASLFARHRRAAGQRLELTLDAVATRRNGDVEVSPRAGMRWTPTPRWAVSALGARTHQFAQSLRNAESVVGNVFPADLFVGAGSGGVPVAHSRLGVLAVEFRPIAGIQLGMQAHARHSDGLVLVAVGDGQPFATRAPTIGSGTSRGVSLDAAMSSARFGLVAGYGLQDVRYTGGDSSFVPEHGATHRFEGGVTFFPSGTSSIRLGASLALGRRTTIIGSDFEWEASNLLDRGPEFAGSPQYGGEALGGTTLPPYLRLDLGVRKHWHVQVGGRDASFEVHGTVTNLLKRTNLLSYARDPVTGRSVGVESRPRSPLVVGLDWRF